MYERMCLGIFTSHCDTKRGRLIDASSISWRLLFPLSPLGLDPIAFMSGILMYGLSRVGQALVKRLLLLKPKKVSFLICNRFPVEETLKKENEDQKMLYCVHHS